MRKLIILAMIFAWAGQYALAQNACKCGQSNELLIRYGPSQVTVPADYSNSQKLDSAKRAWQNWLRNLIIAGLAQSCSNANVLVAYECGDCNESPCPYTLHDGCEEDGLTFDEAHWPGHTIKDDTIYQIKAWDGRASHCAKFIMKCTDCFAITGEFSIPLETEAACVDGSFYTTTLSVPMARIPNDPPFTATDAQQYWLDWIRAANGNGIEGDAAWGCPACSDYDGALPCDMAIDLTQSSELPLPVYDEANNSWIFEPTEFTLAYGCNSCNLDELGKLKKTEEALTSLLLYPSITKGQMNVSLQLPLERGQVMIRVFDLAGREVAAEFINNSGDRILLNYNVSEWEAGTYVMQLFIDGNRQQSEKFMVIK